MATTDEELKNLHSDMSACLSIGKGMMVAKQVKTASGRNCLELEIRQEMAEVATRRCTGIEEYVVRIIHLIDLEHFFQATLIEGAVVCHKRQTFNLWGYLLPNERKYRRIVSVFRAQPMNLLAEPLVILRLRMDQ